MQSPSFGAETTPLPEAPWQPLSVAEILVRGIAAQHGLRDGQSLLPSRLAETLSDLHCSLRLSLPEAASSLPFHRSCICAINCECSSFPPVLSFTDVALQ